VFSLFLFLLVMWLCHWLALVCRWPVSVAGGCALLAVPMAGGGVPLAMPMAAAAAPLAGAHSWCRYAAGRARARARGWWRCAAGWCPWLVLVCRWPCS